MTVYTVGAYIEGKCLTCNKEKGTRTTFEIQEVGANKINGCPTAKGTCPGCGRTLFVIGKKEK